MTQEQQARQWFDDHASPARNRVIAMCDDLQPVYLLLAEYLDSAALASHAPSAPSEALKLAREVATEVGGRFADAHRLNTGLNKFIKRLESKVSEAAAQPTRKTVPEETLSDEIRLGKRKLCGHIAECDCQNGIFVGPEIEHNDH